MATPWETEQARRKALIEQIYYQELGRSDVDAEGMKYWMDQAHTLNNDSKLRDYIRSAAGVTGPAVNPDLTKDQTYAAYLRQMQFDEAGIQTSLDRARTNAQAAIAAQSPLFDQQRAQAQDNVNDSFESRGMFRSGGRLAAGAESRNAIDTNQRQFETGQNQSIADAEFSASQDIASLRRQKAEQEVAARNRLTQGSVK